MTHGCFQGLDPCGSMASYTGCPGKRAATSEAGTFAGTETTPVTVNGSTLTITVPAHTAMLVTLNP